LWSLDKNGDHMTKPEDDKKVRISIKEITVEFDQELRPIERILAGLMEFFEGFSLVDRKQKKL